MPDSSACCPPAARETCCEPSAKETCCGTSGTATADAPARCGCSTPAAGKPDARLGAEA